MLWRASREPRFIIESGEQPSARAVARTPEQLEDNLGAVGWELTDEEVDRLNDVSAIPAGYPYRMMREYGARLGEEP